MHPSTSEEPISVPGSLAALTADQIRTVVEDELQNTSFIDVHTHLYRPTSASWDCGASMN